VQSELGQQLIKDPYSFDFLTLGPDLLERDRGSQDFYLDLLFYHLRLRCFMVINLKIEEFKPEFAGKMNFYLSSVDEQLRYPDDGPSIGIILCKGTYDIAKDRSQELLMRHGEECTPEQITSQQSRTRRAQPRPAPE
jgi:YhcG PDDEXK nuclease domain